MKPAKILQSKHRLFINYHYSEGLRTLVISQKLLDISFYEDWNRRYQDAKADLNNREQSIQNCINELEQDMELLGITGVEDKL